MHDNKLHIYGDVFAPKPFRCDIELPKVWTCNLEAPITNLPVGTRGKINLRSSEPYFVTSLKSKPALVSLSNNHIFDYGDAGFTDTKAALAKLNIPFYGIENTPESSARLVVANKCIAFLGYACPSTHPSTGKVHRACVFDMPTVAADIQAAKKSGADRVIVSIHWGDEEIPLPSSENRIKAAQIIAAGADMVTGHHAHCIQGVEVFNGKPVFYGLGNFVTPDLNEPCEYGPNGEVTRTYRKQQYFWNQRSLAVTWDPVTGDWTSKFWRFRGGRLTLAGGSVDEIMVSAPNDEAYRKAYSRVILKRTIMRPFFDVFCQPTWPKPRKLKTALKLMGALVTRKR